MEKRSVSISKLITGYVVEVIVLLGITILALLIAFNILVSNGAINTANQVENEVNSWIDHCVELGEINLETFPQAADYILEQGDGETAQYSEDATDNKGLKKFMEEYHSGGKGMIVKGQDVYLTVKSGNDILYIHYVIGMNHGILIGFMVFIILSLEIIIPTIILIRRIKRAISIVDTYTKQLSSKDLEACKVSSQITEFDDIMSTMDDMKNELVDSLENKWLMEQKAKEEMAQIAHDIKTPLTVIRGNADLLMESVTDEDDIESVDTIIKSAERIVHSVLRILEK